MRKGRAGVLVGLGVVKHHQRLGSVLIVAGVGLCLACGDTKTGDAQSETPASAGSEAAGGATGTATDAGGASTGDASLATNDTGSVGADGGSSASGGSPGSQTSQASQSATTGAVVSGTSATSVGGVTATSGAVATSTTGATGSTGTGGNGQDCCVTPLRVELVPPVDVAAMAGVEIEICVDDACSTGTFPYVDLTDIIGLAINFNTEPFDGYEYGYLVQLYNAPEMIEIQHGEVSGDHLVVTFRRGDTVLSMVDTDLEQVPTACEGCTISSYSDFE